MGSDGALEGHLRTAGVVHARPLAGGGGHQNKLMLVLRGGVGVAAKPGDDGARMTEQARHEVAAWLLAIELGFDWLVPATVLRQIPDGAGNTTEGSVQVIWPRFNTAMAAQVTSVHCSDDVAWPIAVFDFLIANTDRNDGNWGVIDGLPQAALIDHGHPFFDPASTSPFAARFQGQPIPVPLIDAVQAFKDQATTSRTLEFLSDPEMQALLRRTDVLLNGRVIP